VRRRVGGSRVRAAIRGASVRLIRGSWGDSTVEHAPALGRRWDRGGTGAAGGAEIRDGQVSNRPPRLGRTGGLEAGSKVVMSAEHVDELRRRLAEPTTQDSTSDRVTTIRLAAMRRRLSELERTSENSNDEVVVMAAEQEALEIMDSLENVRDLRSPDDG
jgi:phage tail tape-measure protein